MGQSISKKKNIAQKASSSSDVTVSSGTTNYVPFYTSSNTVGSSADFQFDDSTDSLKLGSSYINKTTMGGITTNGVEFKSGSTIGVFSFTNANTNGVPRVYIMPNGTPTGTTAKFEIFNTNYASGSANYSGFNLFTNNSNNTIWMGGNVAGSATRLRMVIAGKYNASVVDAGSNAITFETDETLRINETGGGVGVGGAAVASAKLAITSTTQGVLFPRMTTAQKNAISSPTAGLVVYDTTLGKLCVYTTTWETITSS